MELEPLYTRGEAVHAGTNLIWICYGSFRHWDRCCRTFSWGLKPRHQQYEGWHSLNDAKSSRSHDFRSQDIHRMKQVDLIPPYLRAAINTWLPLRSRTSRPRVEQTAPKYNISAPLMTLHRWWRGQLSYRLPLGRTSSLGAVVLDQNLRLQQLIEVLESHLRFALMR